MKRFHEYYIGGPLDGQVRNPNKPAPFMIEAIEYVDLLGAPEFHPDHVTDTETYVKWTYYPHRYMLGTHVVTFWSDDRMLSKELIKARFWELILKPHEFIPETTQEGVPA